MAEKKLSSGQRNIMRLVVKGADAEGWAPVGKPLVPLVKQELPAALAELEMVGDDGRARVRLTPEGRRVYEAMSWL
jgi:hypothetical protein